MCILEYDVCHTPRGRGDEEAVWVLEHNRIFNDNVDGVSNEGRHLTADVKTGKPRAYKQKEIKRGRTEQVGSNQTRLETKKLITGKKLKWAWKHSEHVETQDTGDTGLTMCAMFTYLLPHAHSRLLFSWTCFTAYSNILQNKRSKMLKIQYCNEKNLEQIFYCKLVVLVGSVKRV